MQCDWEGEEETVMKIDQDKKKLDDESKRKHIHNKANKDIIRDIENVFLFFHQTSSFNLHTFRTDMSRDVVGKLSN